MGLWKKIQIWWYQSELNDLREILEGQEGVGTNRYPNFGSVDAETLSQQYRLQYVKGRLYSLTGKLPD